MRSKPPQTLFGKRLREARLASGIPQDQLGVAIGFDEGTASARISRYETGTHEPKYENAVRLAKALGIETAYLYAADDELAELLLAWGSLSKAAKKRIRGLIDAEIIGTKKPVSR